MAEPRRKWWRRLLLVIAVGPGLIALITWIRPQIAHEAQAYPAAANAFLFGLWGLIAGLLRRSLAKAMLGLNVGAVLGGCLLSLHYDLLAVPLKPRWGVAQGLVGMALGAALSVNRKQPFSSTLLGAASGLVAVTLSCQLKNVARLFIDSSDFIFPFLVYTPGLYLFFWLIADVLPRREAAREKDANA